MRSWRWAGLMIAMLLGCAACSGSHAHPDAAGQDAATDAEAAPPDAALDAADKDGSFAEAGTGNDGPPGTDLVDISKCSGDLGLNVPLPGTTGSAVASFDPSHTYVVFIDDSNNAVITRYDGSSCSKPVNINAPGEAPQEPSHDAPNVFLDGQGTLYASYFPSMTAPPFDAPAPPMRKSTTPLDETTLGPSYRARLFTQAEILGSTLADGSLLLVGSNFPSRIDRIEPDGSYLWSASRQVVTQDTSSSGAPTGCQGNRFTKAVVRQGPGPGPGPSLYAVWGWARGGSVTATCNDQDVQYYVEDSHEVFFAYSDDGGVTWHNQSGSRTVTAPLCAVRSDCESIVTAGILHNDPDFRITTTRQRNPRAIWVAADGTIYIVFDHSTWCDSGVCTGQNVTNPGALTLLTFKRGSGTVKEQIINAQEHYGIGGVREFNGKLYVWAEQNGGIYEYVSPDGGANWSRTPIVSAGCGRLQGMTHNGLRPRTVDMVFACIQGSSSTRHIYLYRRTF